MIMISIPFAQWPSIITFSGETGTHLLKKVAIGNNINTYKYPLSYSNGQTFVDKFKIGAIFQYTWGFCGVVSMP